MSGVEEGIAVTELVAMAVGTGVTAYGQQQQAAQQQNIANYNYALQRQNNAISAQYAQYQAQVNAQVTQSQAQQQQNNATALENQALATEMQTRTQIAAMREKQAQALAQQRAALGASGVTTAGTSLFLEADNAGKAQQQIEDLLQQGNQQAANYRQQAEDQRYQSGLNLLNANMQTYAGTKALLGQQIGDAQAKGDLYTGLAKANSDYTDSYLTLLNGTSKLSGGYLADKKAGYFS